MRPIENLTQLLLQKLGAHSEHHVFTVALSGIDASGKGYVARLLEAEMKNYGVKVANINVDPWQNPIDVRLRKENSAENFYHRVFRWKDFFQQLIIPLKQNGRIRLRTRLIQSHADKYYDFNYDFEGIDILLVEGILLFQQRFLHHFDYKVWIDSGFETGMKRALQRNIEKLNHSDLVDAYNTYYYPAQRYHFVKDNPTALCDAFYCNDELLGIVGQVTVNSLKTV
jgi:uridine kinase